MSWLVPDICVSCGKPVDPEGWNAEPAGRGWKHVDCMAGSPIRGNGTDVPKTPPDVPKSP